MKASQMTCRQLSHLAELDDSQEQTNGLRKHLPLNSRITEYVPPLSIILHGIRTILFSVFATKHIPDLLDLLTTVEFYRDKILEKAQTAIDWNRYYQTINDSETVLLADDEKKYLESLLQKKDQYRKIYIKILSHCCHLDMYLLWTAQPPSLTTFFIRFNEYFPSLNKQIDERDSPCLFHSDLSSQEKMLLLEVGLTCGDYVRHTIMLMQIKGSSFQGALMSDEFQDEFPCPNINESLHELIEYYIQNVDKMAECVEKMLP